MRPASLAFVEDDPSVSSARYDSGERAKLLTPPPRTGRALCRAIGKPVSPQYCSHVRWWRAVKRIASEEREHARASLQESFLREHDPRGRAPRPE